MKAIKKYTTHHTYRVLFILFITLFVSCDDFLDVKPQAGVTPESDPRLAEKLVTGVYNSLLQGDSWGKGDTHGFAYISVTSIMSDDADKGSTASDQLVPVGALDDFLHTPTNVFCESLWAGHYNGIGAANQAIKAVQSSALDTELKTQYLGEVKFLRGYFYFNLVRMFGGVPLVLRVARDADDANTDPMFKTRVAESVVYDSIIHDLEFAVNSLAEKSAANGHATKGAAQAMLAKAYLYKASTTDAAADWQKVYDLTEAVIASTKYDLATDYATIWRQEGENNIESIFEIQTGKFNNANFKINNYTGCQGPRTGGAGGWDDMGWGFNNPSLSLINAYEPNDLRKAATIIFIDNSGTHAGTTFWDGRRIPSSDSVQNLYYNYKAYTSKTKEDYAVPNEKDRPKNIRVLRYAEVLLMNAEAAQRLGTGDADARVNEVRERAGLDGLTGVTREQIWNERRLELAMEHDRFWDLVRQDRRSPGRMAAIMHASGKTNFTAGKHELLPIPNSQILLSGNVLTQNPNY